MVMELFVTRAYYYFGGVEYDYDKAKAVVVGVPFEASTTYKTGTRFAPYSIRMSSANIEFYSLRANIDVDEIPIHDLGDIVVSANKTETLERIETVTATLADDVDKKIIVFLGGEHTITLGLVKGLVHRKKNVCLVVADAHFDLREEYLGDRFSHATVARRLAEIVGPENLVFYGVRAFTREEREYALRNNVTFISSREILSSPINSLERLLDKLATMTKCTHVHFSIDMDVYDPSYAPGVGNPEPEGLTPSLVFDLIHSIIPRIHASGQTISVDVVEVSPPNDCNDITSVLAAKTIVEVIASWYASKTSSPT